MRSHILGVCFLAIVVGGLLGLSANKPVHSQEKKIEDRTLTVMVTADFQPVTVTLSRDGKGVVTRDIQDGATYKFLNLTRGLYEVRFESPKRTTQIKKVSLEEFDSELITNLDKDTGTVVLGGGPSLQELETRIKQIEERLAKPQEK